VLLCDGVASIELLGGRDWGNADWKGEGRWGVEDGLARRIYTFFKGR